MTSLALGVLQLKSHPIEIPPVGRNDTIGHVERRAAESKHLAEWLDNDFLGLLLGAPMLGILD